MFTPAILLNQECLFAVLQTPALPTMAFDTTDLSYIPHFGTPWLTWTCTTMPVQNILQSSIVVVYHTVLFTHKSV